MEFVRARDVVLGKVILIFRDSFYSIETVASDDYQQSRRSSSSSGRRHNEWLVGNVTGVAVDGGNRIEYAVSRKLLQLKIGDSDNRRYLSLSAYAVNRMGRSPDVRIGGEDTVSLRHPWWWNGGGGGTEEASTRIAVSGGTTSTGIVYMNTHGRMRFHKLTL